MAAALAHSAADVDVEVHGQGPPWLVSYRRTQATTTPCGFRHLVLAAMRGCPVRSFPVEAIRYVGALREIGGGIYERLGQHGPDRAIATFLDAEAVERVLAAAPREAADELSAHIHCDRELGVSVITLRSAHPVFDIRLDVMAHAVAASCLVEELIGADREAAS